MLHFLELLYETICSFFQMHFYAFKSNLGGRVHLFCLFNAQVAKFLFCRRIQVVKSAGSEEYIEKRKHFKRDVQVKPAEAGLLLKHIASFLKRINNLVQTATSPRNRLHYFLRKTLSGFFTDVYVDEDTVVR